MTGRQSDDPGAGAIGMSKNEGQTTISEVPVRMYA